MDVEMCGVDGLDVADEWRKVRRHLNEHRHELALGTGALYPDLPTAGSTRLLTRHAWMPPEPIDLRRVVLTWDDAAPDPLVTGREAEAAGALTAGLGSYAEAIGFLDRPRLFEDRMCYRLLDVAWPELRFTRARYFDPVNVGEAAAHEFAARRPAGGALPLRDLVGDPTDLIRRVAVPAVSMLTLRRDGRSGESTFVLHRRDPALVAHGGGLYQVMPVGVFQPVAQHSPADFDLWTCVVREYAEEFLGRPERYGPGFDYETWPFYRDMTGAREDGRLRSWLLGLGVDPLTFATDLLAVTVIEARTYDALFGGLVDANEEGVVVGVQGIPFDEETVGRYVHHEPMQAAGAAALDLAWRHRDVIAGLA
jgi:hypothetical protein